ncbi:hypothetical protein EGI22_22925 [Lacihabitans sp. LS3-19]|uniref:FG-GAP repeat protein n=1 Tax=Lacihabitans sp. LS3-19 TaxID=2487335 RepID=UPI0020CDDDA6|nr:FG-GAP repeat protein [Lacihabitans sp. LS3-19]MCP9770768.1 hypothetical protein [Lacihabitans sp. LS3-19]
MKYLVICLLFLISVAAKAQSVTIDPANSNGVLMEAKSSNQGVVLARMTTTERKAINNPNAGTLVYDKDKLRYYLFDGQLWLALKLDLETELIANERTISNAAAKYFRMRVAVSQKWAAVGLPEENVNGLQNKGAVIIFEKTLNGWIQRTKLSPADGQSNDRFGGSVAIKGDSLIVGAPYSLNGNRVNGAVYFYKYITSFIPNIGTIKYWSLQVKLQSNISSTGHSEFGQNVAFDNNHLVVGTNGQDGIVYVYNNLNQNWTFGQTLQIPLSSSSSNTLGRKIALSGDYLAIGAPYNNDESGQTTGAAFIFVKGGGTWTLQKILYGDYDGDSFGFDICLVNETLFVSSPRFDNDKGGVRIFKRSGSNWLYNKLIRPFDAQILPVYQETIRFGDYISAKNDYLFISSLTGTVAVFKKDEYGFWSLYDKINCTKYPFAVSADMDVNSSTLIIGKYEDAKIKFVNIE